MVLLSHWFPSAERARANALWNLCQPLAVVASAPVTGWLLGAYGWQPTLIMEGALPFIWLPIWWFFICDHPREARWLPPAEKEFLEATLRCETAQLDPAKKVPFGSGLWRREILVMIVINVLHNAAAYGCMTFFTETLNAKHFSPAQRGFLLAVPYALTAVIMVVNSWHSDKTRERRGHVALVYTISGTSLILSVLTRDNFWLSFGFLCLAIPGPFRSSWPRSGQSPPKPCRARCPVRSLAWPTDWEIRVDISGRCLSAGLRHSHHSTAIPFSALGAGLLAGAALAFLLPGRRIDDHTGREASH